MSDTPEAPFTIVYLTIGSGAWIVAALKLRAWRRDPSRGLLVVALTIAAPSTAFVVAAPVMYRLIDRSWASAIWPRCWSIWASRASPRAPS
ncbi:hypothetical protein ABZS86_15355 [Streptomyces sp. NPDC005355]|uniref:hypothetical protein n=1 Tax=Streptomyces sp. NPDC005355 TaxID=3157038 RepID=UPI0033BCB191